MLNGILPPTRPLQFISILWALLGAPFDGRPRDSRNWLVTTKSSPSSAEVQTLSSLLAAGQPPCSVFAVFSVSPILLFIRTNNPPIPPLNIRQPIRVCPSYVLLWLTTIFRIDLKRV
ncbi:hypothetical protein VTN49DRAFT_6826 [Thermomyces lanuginosus]|uniref:uncharacterized protein n=1 Tax=Thermomyces lanuginosus TaxID=5541 RepID=UPI003743921F